MLAGLLDPPPAGVVALNCDVDLPKVPPSDMSDSRGRSPVTGTSAGSAHQSRHQLNRG